MLWAGTPGAVLGPRHIDWGPGGCARARRSLLYGHSLNVGWAATNAATAAAAVVVVSLESTRHTRLHSAESTNTLNKFSGVSNKSDENPKSPRTPFEQHDGIEYLTLYVSSFCETTSIVVLLLILILVACCFFLSNLSHNIKLFQYNIYNIHITI